MDIEPIGDAENVISGMVVEAAIEVHRALGPGFCERVYEKALAHELMLRKLMVQTQREVVVTYKGMKMPEQFLDMVVEGRVVVELKAVDEFRPVHEAQLLSYLKASKLRLGLLLNFNVKMMKNGIKRIVR